MTRPEIKIIATGIQDEDLSCLKRIVNDIRDNITGEVLFLQDHTKEYIHSIVNDVTESKKRERQLRLLKRSVEQSPVSLFITDTKGIIDYVNRTFTELTGYTQDELKGRVLRILKPGNTSESVYKNIWYNLNEGREWKGEHQNRKKDGTVYWEKILISPVKNKKGLAENFIVISEDISKWKEIESDLVAAKEMAEESDRLKSAFLANMSHEIRTPMNGILGFLDLFRNPDIPDANKDHYIEIVKESGGRLLDTINDIIEISKIEVGQSKIELSQVNPSGELEYLLEFFRLDAEKKGLVLKLRNDLPEKNKTIYTDKAKLISILSNLIKNSIKFTSKGIVEFGAGLKRNQLIFYVKDTGIGIPEEKIKVVFDRFVQADTNIAKPYEGSGLGLAIAKSYTELLGGKISVESEVGRGTNFIVMLSYHPGDEAPPEADSKIYRTIATKTQMNILIAEDDEISWLYLKELLSGPEFSLKRACNGEEAVMITMNDPDIDLVLMDIKMPIMNGYDAVKEIRKFNKKIPIIAQTAYALAGDREKAIDAGCNDHISKPIIKDELLGYLSRHIK